MASEETDGEEAQSNVAAYRNGDTQWDGPSGVNIGGAYQPVVPVLAALSWCLKWRSNAATKARTP